MIPEQLLKDPRIDSKSFKVYATLLSFRNRKTGRCFPSMPKIELRAAMCDKSVRSALDNLESSGWIKRLKKKGEVNNYLIYFSQADQQVSQTRTGENSNGSDQKNSVGAARKYGANPVILKADLGQAVNNHDGATQAKGAEYWSRKHGANPDIYE